MSDAPNIQYGSQTDYGTLYVSKSEAALKLQGTIQAGYGTLQAGQVLARNLSADGGVGKYVPYNLTSFDGTEASPGRAYLVADSGTSTTAYVTINDSYKFVVGDDLCINSDGETAESLGAITAIDVTSETQRAKITFTTSITNDMTTAGYAYVCVEAGVASNSYSDAVGILEISVDTGTGSTAAGALAPVIVSNAILYGGMLSGNDDASVTDLSAVEVGNNYILK